MPSPWLVDPLERVLTGLELQGGRYVERFRGAGAYQAAAPFPVAVGLG